MTGIRAAVRVMRPLVDTFEHQRKECGFQMTEMGASDAAKSFWTEILHDQKLKVFAFMPAEGNKWQGDWLGRGPEVQATPRAQVSWQREKHETGRR